MVDMHDYNEAPTADQNQEAPPPLQMTMKRAYKEAPAADHNESLVAIQHKVLANVSLVDEALVKCQENCPYELYTYQQPDRRFKINTFRDEHTCTRGW